LLLSSIFFLAAASIRIEVILFVIISPLYILTVERNARLARITCFLMPVVLLGACLAVGSKIFGFSLADIFRIEAIPGKVLSPFTDYTTLRAHLARLMDHQVGGNLGNFLEHSHHLVWLIAFGAVIRAVIEDALFYPFFVVFALGIPSIVARARKDRRVLYLLFLAIGSILLLYAHVLDVWIMSSRFLALFAIPAFVFVGFGLEKIRKWLQSHFTLQANTALTIICFFILAFGLAKTLRPNRSDKLVYRKIGEFISQSSTNEKPVRLVAISHQARTSFYANIDQKNAPYNFPTQNCLGRGVSSYAELVRKLKKGNIMYFLWEEREWPTDNFPFMDEVKEEDLAEIKSWTDPYRGRLVLFEVIA